MLLWWTWMNMAYHAESQYHADEWKHNEHRMHRTTQAGSGCGQSLGASDDESVGSFLHIPQHAAWQNVWIMLRPLRCVKQNWRHMKRKTNHYHQAGLRPLRPWRGMKRCRLPDLRTSTIWCRRRMKRSCNSRSPQQSTVQCSVVAKFFHERNNALWTAMHFMCFGLFGFSIFCVVTFWCTV